MAKEYRINIAQGVSVCISREALNYLITRDSSGDGENFSPQQYADTANHISKTVSRSSKLSRPVITAIAEMIDEVLRY